MNQTIDSQEKLTISDYRYWLNLKIFIRTLAAGALLLGALLFWVERSKPPEGYIFERLPPIVGEWGHPNAGLRTSSSTVGFQHIVCTFPPILYGGVAGDCEYLKIEPGTVVSVTVVRIPFVGSHLKSGATFVQKIESESGKYLEIADAKISEKWISHVRKEIGRLLIDVFIVFYIVQILVLRKFFKR